jgi:hypothetical protein
MAAVQNGFLVFSGPNLRRRRYYQIGQKTLIAKQAP